MNHPPPSGRELLRIHLRTLFRLDVRGRLRAVNEPGDRLAPRIYVASGGGERIVRTRADLPELIARAWLACATEAELREKVAAHAEVTHEYRGPAFALPHLTAPENALPVGPATLLHPELVARGWKRDERGPSWGGAGAALVVSVCSSSRLSPEAAAAGVETVTAYRGQGLVLEAIRAWAASVQAGGRLAFYSTEWTNEASRRVAAKLDAHEFGEDWHLT